MEVTELTLWAARLGVLALMYLLVMALIFALRADARAAATAPLRPKQSPLPTPATPVATPAPVAAPPPTSRSLVVQAGTLPTTGREYQLFGMVEIGRGEECTITIPNKFVSTHHARVFQQNGQWLAEDLGSTNGTLLNGKTFSGTQPLKPGDHLMVGDTDFVVK